MWMKKVSENYYKTTFESEGWEGWDFGWFSNYESY